MATYPIRPVAEDELADFLAVDQHASHSTPISERARVNLLARLDFGRTLAAFDGDTIVGGTGAFSFQMRVPGALAAVAGVSLVAVLPSHRRQGILSALMRRQLADVSERGEAVAVLFSLRIGHLRAVRLRARLLARRLPVAARRGHAGTRRTG